MRIATFNLESLDDRPGIDVPLTARIDVLRPQLLRLRADVLCLQEVNAQESKSGGVRRLTALARLIEGTPYEAHHQIASMRPSGKGPADLHNLVILSRFPVASWRQYRHDLVPPLQHRLLSADPTCTTPIPVEFDRPILYAGLEVGGRILHVLNLHLRAPLASFIPGQKDGAYVWRSVAGWSEGYYLSSVKRAGQALEARLVVEQLFAAEPAPWIVVCGDLNSDEHEVPVRILRSDPGDTGNADLAGRSLEPLERAIPASQRYSVLHDGRRQLLDHVLVSPAMLEVARGIEIYNEGLADEALERHLRPADSFHAPLVAELDLSDSGAIHPQSDHR